MTPKTCAAGRGDPMDLSLAVHALLGIMGRPKDARGDRRRLGGFHGIQAPLARDAFQHGSSVVRERDP